MSAGTSGSPSGADVGSPLLQHEIRRDGRVIATLRAHQTPAGITVESRVFPVTGDPGSDAISRPFNFTTMDHARRFVDDALVSFEYLNCSVA